MKQDYRLIAIADEGVLEGHDFVAACQAAADGGATCLQLRMKKAPSSRFLEVAEKVVSRVAVPVFINDRVDVAVLSGAEGVHLGWDDIPVSKAAAIEGADVLRFGMSVGSPIEAEKAVEHARVAYWGSGPVYATGSKLDAGDAIGLDGLSGLILLAKETPVVAIGGIRATNCSEILAAGAIGVAVIGGIFGSGDIEANTKCFRDALDSSPA